MLRNEDTYRVSAIILLLSVLSVVLSSCGLNRWLLLESGVYTFLPNMGSTESITVVGDLEVDRDNQLVKFTVEDGSKVKASFTFREIETWPVGCPANIGSTYMEILDIEEGSLTLGALTFEDPILVRDCPPEPMRVVLREDGPVGGGSDCAGQEKCLYFSKQPDTDPQMTAPINNSKPLPSSMKGYEIYCWYGEEQDGWHYTLITGTNRLKTYKEITAGEDTITSGGWVKITVTGEDALKALLVRLPEGEDIVWRDEGWLVK
jgi:hypothetical protein